VWQGQLSVSTSTDVTAAVVVEHCGGAELRDVAVTVAVYARYAGATYIDAAHTSRLTLDAFGSCSVSGVIDNELLRDDKSVYVVNDCLHVRVFVRSLLSP